MIARKQRGVAAVTAILVVAVAASAATYMLAQQSATLNQAVLIASRAQADLFAQAGLDWARGVLAQDARSSVTDTLLEPWAQPMAGLPVERAVVGGSIADAQGRFNLNNLVTNGQRSEADVQILRRLLASLQLDPNLAFAVLDWVDADSDVTGASGAEDAFYLSLPRPYRAANQPMVQVEELYRIRGFDAAAVDKLRPHVSALPGRTAVNANTASSEVLAAIMPELSADEVLSLVQSRNARPFKDKADLAGRAKKASAPALDTAIDVKSSFFVVRVNVAQDDVFLGEEALVARGANASTAIIWRHPLY